MSQFEKIPATKKVTKIVCFGLGDFCDKPPEWVRRQSSAGEDETDLDLVRDRMIQHSMALTMAEICHDDTAKNAQLLAQDPNYSEQTMEILKASGFTIVGQFGAGGFAEIDNNSLVFSAFS